MTERGISQAESWTVLVFCLLASSVAIVWSWQHGAMLNYGDAVAHLHIARRVLDSRTPRLTQLGSVWLPLPHILLLPFVQNFAWWASGLAGVIPSAAAYLGACAGLYRLARQWMNIPAAALALGFFALNPNLLYMQTTAMTEPLFLCEVIWVVVWMVEWRVAIAEEIEAMSFNFPQAQTAPEGFRRRLAPVTRKPLRIFEAGKKSRGRWLRNPAIPGVERPGALDTRTGLLMTGVALALVAAVYTRYDGWIMALLVWTGVGLTLRRCRQLRSPLFWRLSAIVVAAPLLWFLYNAVGFGDWLYFARGPYSAKAIEMRTAVAGGWPLHPGWHDSWTALLYYLKVSELDAAAVAWGNALLAIAAVGTIALWVSRKAGVLSSQSRRIYGWTMLLWLPVPFYTYSVAYGSVPIFFPSWWPYTLYNTRYGLELLPALALGLGCAAQAATGLLRRIHSEKFAWMSTVGSSLAVVATLVLFVLGGMNLYTMFREQPVVYEESTKNMEARLDYDENIPAALDELLQPAPRSPVLMNTSMYPEIVAMARIPLKQTINESDLNIFRTALEAPAQHAAIVVAFEGDEVDRAIRANPEGLTLSKTFIAKGQPTASIYVSTKWADQIQKMTLPETPKDLLPDDTETPQKDETPAPQQPSK